MITIYGASDDLVEVDGDLSEEFTYLEGRDNNAQSVLGFSDGTVLTIEYDANGFWRIAPLHHGTASLQVRQATDADDDYSDRATLDTVDGPLIKWVVYGHQYVAAKVAG